MRIAISKERHDALRIVADKGLELDKDCKALMQNATKQLYGAYRIASSKSFDALIRRAACRRATKSCRAANSRRAAKSLKAQQHRLHKAATAFSLQHHMG